MRTGVAVWRDAWDSLTRWVLGSIAESELWMRSTVVAGLPPSNLYNTLGLINSPPNGPILCVRATECLSAPR
jgi:hypothetical protein